MKAVTPVGLLKVLASVPAFGSVRAAGAGMLSRERDATSSPPLRRFRALFSGASRTALQVDPVFAATLALFAVYLILFALLPSGGFYIGDQGVKYLQVDTLARTRTLAMGELEDPLSVFRIAFNGSFYRDVGAGYHANFSPAYALLVLPFYLVFGKAGLVLPSAIGAALTAYAAGQLGRQLNVRHPWAIVLVVGLASPLLFYATVFWEHAPSVALLAFASLLALQSRAFGSGLLCALSVWLRPEAYLFAPILILAVFGAFGTQAGLHFFPRFVGGFLAGIGPWWAFNFLTVGTPVGLSAAKEVLQPFNFTERVYVVSVAILPFGQKKWLLLVAVVLAMFGLLRLLKRSPLPALWLLCLGSVGIGILNLFRVGADEYPGLHSVIDSFPFALAAVACLVAFRISPRARFLWILAGGLLVTTTVAILIIPGVDPGGGWGPRYFLALYPPLAVLAWVGLEATQDRLTRGALLAVVVVSLLFQAVGVKQSYNAGTMWTELNDTLETLEPKTIATAVWWLPQVASPTHPNIRWYGVVDESDLKTIAQTGEAFWWIWAPEAPVGADLLPLRTEPSPTIQGFAPVARRDLNVRQLEAVLYTPVQ